MWKVEKSHKFLFPVILEQCAEGSFSINLMIKIVQKYFDGQKKSNRFQPEMSKSLDMCNK